MNQPQLGLKVSNCACHLGLAVHLHIHRLDVGTEHYPGQEAGNKLCNQKGVCRV